ncbi:hypothetical protein, partial [Enterococcus cecorum]|uniref:hypothetical protein n=1 Tax=Enterococcus cecorum TaxID=44008 RepID=UPI001FAE4343
SPSPVADQKVKIHSRLLHRPKEGTAIPEYPIDRARTTNPHNSTAASDLYKKQRKGNHNLESFNLSAFILQKTDLHRVSR